MKARMDKDGVVLGPKYYEKTKRFGEGILVYSAVLYFLIIAAAIMPMFFKQR